MTIDEYLKRPDAPTLAEFASLIGVSRSGLCHIRKGNRAWTVKNALAAERASDFVLDAGELCPDVAAVRAQVRP